MGWLFLPYISGLHPACDGTASTSTVKGSNIFCPSPQHAPNPTGYPLARAEPPDGQNILEAASGQAFDSRRSSHVRRLSGEGPGAASRSDACPRGAPGQPLTASRHHHQQTTNRRPACALTYLVRVRRTLVMRRSERGQETDESAQVGDRLCKPICKQDTAVQAETGDAHHRRRPPAAPPPRSAHMSETGQGAGDACLVPHNPATAHREPLGIPDLGLGWTAVRRELELSWHGVELRGRRCVSGNYC